MQNSQRNTAVFCRQNLAKSTSQSIFKRMYCLIPAIYFSQIGRYVFLTVLNRCLARITTILEETEHLEELKEMLLKKNHFQQEVVHTGLKSEIKEVQKWLIKRLQVKKKESKVVKTKIQVMREKKELDRKKKLQKVKEKHDIDQ